jgi:guanosine-3',5'-bis(diphosphate) 3'-pyrophosphohydrolase
LIVDFVAATVAVILSFGCFEIGRLNLARAWTSQRNAGFTFLIMEKGSASALDPGELLRALAFAARKHRDQRRKDAEASPYINHPIAVASVLATEAGVTDRVTLLAAILHDTVEDTETKSEELEWEFGPEIASVVAEVTDDKSLPKNVRKDLQVRHATAASSRAKAVKIADKTCNVRDVTSAPPEGWSLDRRKEYVDWAVQVVAGCRGEEPDLDAVFDRAVEESRRVMGDGE